MGEKGGCEEENRMLKRAIASLYGKLKSAEVKVKGLVEENEKLTREKEFYKNRSKLLMEEQFSQ